MRNYIIFFMLALGTQLHAQFVPKTSTPFAGVNFSAAAYADVDGDGHLDVLITGENNATQRIAKLYKNDGDANYTEVIGTSFIGVRQGAVAFFNADGSNGEDVLITGLSGLGQPVTKLYLNDGTGSFTEVNSTIFEAVYTSSISVADVDGDGDEDVFISGLTGSIQRVSKLYLNDGNASFTLSTSVFTPVFASSTAFADVDGVNGLDLMVSGYNASNVPTTNLYKNDGSGNFTPDTGSTFAGVADGSITFSDIDGDLDQDVLITGLSAGSQRTATLYINDGTGSFIQDSNSSFEGVFRSASAFVDVDGDSDKDVIITGQNNAGVNTSKIYMNSGSGLFTENTAASLEGIFAGSLLTLDVDGDTHLDLLLTGINNSSQRVAKLYINDRISYTAVTATNLPGVEYGDVAFADVDGDDDLDLFLSGGMGRTGIAKLYLSDGIGNYQEAPENSFVGVNSSAIDFSDIDLDGDQDLLVTGYVGSNQPDTRLYKNNGAGVFTEVLGTGITAIQNGSVAFLDTDNDGDEDLLITGSSTNNLIIELYTNDGNGNFTRVINTPFPVVYSAALEVADFNNDNFEDIIITGGDVNTGQGTTTIFINDGTGVFTELTSATLVGIHTGSIAIADVDGNNYQDIVISGNGISGTISKLYLNNNLSFTESTGAIFESTNTGSIAFADIDGDDDPDFLITGNSSSGNHVAKLYLNDGSGAFTEKMNTSLTPVKNSAVAFADVDGVNGIDVIITGYTNPFPSISKIFNNDGNGNFNERIGPPFKGNSGGEVIFADVDGDNDDDVLITGSGNFSENIKTAELYINDGSGNYELSLTANLEGGKEGGVAFSDIDGDNDLDLLLAGTTISNSLTTNLYVNDGNGNFSLTSSPFDLVFSGDIAFSDVDNDNDEDLVIIGLNSAYNGTVAKLYLNNGAGVFTEKPGTTFDGVYDAAIAFADVDGVNGEDLLITGFNGANTTKLYLNDGNGNFTVKSGTTFTGVQRGDLAFSDIDGDNDLDLIIMGETSIGQGSITLYLNDGNGNFSVDSGNTFESMSRGSVTFGDVNGDDDQDLLITGRNGSGNSTAHLYSNDGLGNFTLVSTSLFTGVQDSAAAFSDVDSDNDLDVLISGRSGFDELTRLYLNNQRTPNVWTGKQDTNWSNINNWSRSFVPGIKDQAIIRAVPNQPNISDAAAVEIASLITQKNTTLSVKSVLKVNGDILNNGQLVFESTATNSGQFDEFTGTLQGSGNAVIQRYIPSKRAFRFISSPVTTTASIFENWQEAGNAPTGFGTHITGSITGANGFDATETGSPSLFTFDNSTGAWQAIPNTDVENLTAGSPYRLMVRGDRNTVLTASNATPSTTILRSKGALQTGDFSPALSTSASAFSFVGNPYQAVVDFTQVATSNLSDFLYVWDASIAADGAYVSVDLSDLGAPIAGSSDANQFIAPGQAFFVRNTATGNGSITFEESDKSVNSPQVTVFNVFTDFYINSQVYKTSDLLTGGMESDALGLRFRESYTTAGSDEDAVKFTNPGENYAVVNNGLRSIDKQNLPTAGHEIQLSLDNYTTTDYSLSFDMDNKPSDLRVLLHDAYLNTQTELTTDLIYDFIVDMSIAASITTNRFKLIFEQETLGLTTDVTQNIRVYPNPAYNTLQIDVPATTQIESVEFYNMLGQQMMSSKNKTIDITGLRTGVYLVEVITTQGQITHKIIKR